MLLPVEVENGCGWKKYPLGMIHTQEIGRHRYQVQLCSMQVLPSLVGRNRHPNIFNMDPKKRRI